MQGRYPPAFKKETAPMHHSLSDNTNQKKLICHPLVVTLLALLCCALWGSAFPCVKLGYDWFQIKGASSQILFAGIRFTFAGILTFAAGCLIEKRILLLKRSSIPSVLFLGFTQTTLQYVFFYLGLAHTTGSKGSIINASNVFFSILIAHFVIPKEKLNWHKALGCLSGFIGVVLVNFTADGILGGLHLQGEGFILICAFASGASSVIVKLIADKGTPMAITAYQLTFGGLILILAGLLLGGRIPVWSSKALLLLLYLALLSTIAFSIWTLLLKYNPVGQVTIFGFTNPIFGILLSGLILHEQFLSVKNGAALILVCLGIFLVNMSESKTQ